MRFAGGIIRIAVGLWVGLAAGSARASDDRLVSVPDPDSLNIAYEASAPYFEVGVDKITGLFADRIRAALATAGIDAAWLELSYNRSERTVSDGEIPICTISSMRSEPPVGSRFTAPVGWYPRSSIAILRESLPLFERHASLADILADPAIRGGFIANASYGGEIAGLSGADRTRQLFIVGTDEDLAHLVARKRVHFAMINEDQAAHYRAVHPEAPALVSFYPTGMRPRRSLHLLCNAAVADEIFVRLDRALAAGQP